MIFKTQNMYHVLMGLIKLVVVDSIYLSVFHVMYQSGMSSVCLSVCLSIYLSFFLSVCLSQSVYMSVCLSIYLFIYLFIDRVCLTAAAVFQKPNAIPGMSSAKQKMHEYNVVPGSQCIC
jgi:ABC-type transport system involved in multi-copper enzyme maturation permease subunit